MMASGSWASASGSDEGTASAIGVTCEFEIVEAFGVCGAGAAWVATGVIGEIGIPFGVCGAGMACTVAIWSPLAIATLMFRGIGIRIPRNMRGGGMVRDCWVTPGQ